MSSAAPALARRDDRWWRVWRYADVGLAYAVIVAVVSITLALQPGAAIRGIVEQSSTNLVNMRARPVSVLALSAFVVWPTWQLVLLVPAVALYALVQRWLGRGATVLVIVFGHAGATLCVMTAEITALYRHIARFDIVRRPDVGVSYGLAAAAGVVLFALPRRLRLWYGLVSLALVVAMMAIAPDFTNLGHTMGWLIGLALGVLAWAGARAARSSPSTAGPAQPAAEDEPLGDLTASRT